MYTSDPEGATLGRCYLPTLQMEKPRLEYLNWCWDPSLWPSVLRSSQCEHVCARVHSRGGIPATVYTRPCLGWIAESPPGKEGGGCV